MTNLLLMRGARPDICGDSDGYAPLHLLVSTSHRSEDFAYLVVDALLAHGADFRLHTNNNGTVLRTRGWLRSRTSPGACGG